MKIFTIGFTKKSAETFFTRLQQAGVARLVDVRLNNVSQLAGFAKRDDLRYFAKTICGIDSVSTRTPLESTLFCIIRSFVSSGPCLRLRLEVVAFENHARRSLLALLLELFLRLAQRQPDFAAAIDVEHLHFDLVALVQHVFDPPHSFF